jgi:autotransporter passenger strand-loop-strand repeat protein
VGFSFETFAGAISNSGLISAGKFNGIGVFTGSVFGNPVAGGGIVNSGTILANTGISLFDVSTFAGGVTNGGTISAARRGIAIGATSDGLVKGVPTFIGNIANGGTITARTGIGLNGSTITGAIVDNGTIKATSHGILIDSASEILASKTAIAIAGPTFTGGITNFGVISGSAGIEIKTARPVSIFDAGAIVGTGGTAIQFAGSGNTLTLGAGYVIGGIVDPSGKNILQLGGTGSGTFDLSSIGSSAQYRGFTTFNVVGGTWTVTSAGSAQWTIRSGGTEEIASGGVLTSTTVSSGGVLVVDSGATASSSFVKSGGTEIIESGVGRARNRRAIVSGTIANSGTLIASGTGSLLLETISVPPLWTAVPIATPPDDTVSTPPPLIEAPMPVPPNRIFSASSDQPS